MSSRYKGKFCKSNVVKWKQNVIRRNKSRKEQNAEVDSIELTGRRLVDLKILSSDLWCHYCNRALSLKDTFGEVKQGLASIFQVKCTICKRTFDVNTSSTEASSLTRPTYTINSKIVNGAIESGIGNTHLIKILSAAEVPVMHSTVFKRHKKKVGTTIELLAGESYLEHLRAHRELTIEREGLREVSDWTESNVVYLTISYDAVWQKKGSGRSYNSITGHGTAIGFHTGKVVGLATRSKRCIFCESEARRSNVNNDATETSSNSTKKIAHNCRNNFEGSSKKFLDPNSLKNAHNASSDVDVLQKLVEHIEINITQDDIKRNVKSTEVIIKEGIKKVQSKNIKNLLQSLQSNKNEKELGGLSSRMINKIATAGITFENIQRCYILSGSKGIRILLAQDIGGKPRITKRQEIIDNLCKKLALII